MGQYIDYLPRFAEVSFESLSNRVASDVNGQTMLQLADA